MSMLQPAPASSNDHAFLSLPGITEPMKKYLRRLLNGDFVPVTTLRSLVEAYRRVIREESKKKKSQVNLALGEEIANSLLIFIGRLDDRVTRDDLHIVQATVRYFVLENDAGGSDFAHEDGLFDDARIVNAMLRWFGRDDLKVRVPEPAAGRRPTPTSTNFNASR